MDHQKISSGDAFNLLYTCRDCGMQHPSPKWFYTLPCTHALCHPCINRNLGGENMNIIICPKCKVDKDKENKRVQENLRVIAEGLVM